MGEKVIANLLREAEIAAGNRLATFRYGHAGFTLERTAPTEYRVLFENGDDTRIQIRFERGRFTARIA